MRRASFRTVSIASALWVFAITACGQHEGPGVIEGKRVPDPLLADRAARAAEAASRLAAGEPPAKQVLFGDLHVHTTFSADAFMMSLPVFQGEGANPIANACDFARYCSSLDFWSINDHAEGLTPARWQETKESIRQCNAVAGDPESPDLVAFLGWEWTQIGRTPADHYGHKNVILRETADDRVPRRPIHSASFATRAMRERPPFLQVALLPLLDFEHRQYYLNLNKFLAEIRDTPLCEDGVDTRELPDDCSEGAATPQILNEKLAQWGFESLVIPHGTTWGIYTPPGSSWDKQLSLAQHDPERQRLIEVFSGHGNSEEYRTFRAIDFDEQGNAVCPEPHDGYEPCCWRAGEIIRERCEEPGAACEERVRTARENYLDAGVDGRLTVPGAAVEDWKNCGSCTDCFLPAYNYRPGSSVQYILGLSNFTEEAPGASGEPLRFRFGLIASSDNHSARPGTGYKEFARLQTTEARGGRDESWWRRSVAQADEEALPESRRFDRDRTALMANQILDFERQSSFFMTGGLVAVHAEGRSRDAIWGSLLRREVYGTSGERILLWFDLLNAADGPLAMGGEAKLGTTPRFRVRAAGGFVQEPGCPEVALDGLSAERLGALCRGECYNPGDTRHPIVRIEVVRIRPQASPGEPMASLIDDPWRSFACPPDPTGCVVEFEDPEFIASRRENVYYVRAIQAPTQAVNAGQLRCRTDEQGNCIEVTPCYGDYRTAADDDCLAPAEERAWSSPIFVGFDD
jgi:hypothetical protein